MYIQHIENKCATREIDEFMVRSRVFPVGRANGDNIPIAIRRHDYRRRVNEWRAGGLLPVGYYVRSENQGDVCFRMDARLKVNEGT